MKKYKKVISIMIFLISALFITISLSHFAQANQIDLDFSQVINLTNSPVTKDITITNLSSQLKNYNLEIYSAPFTSQLTPSSFQLEAGQSRKVSLEVFPLENTLYQRYIAKIKVNTDNQETYYEFLIIQNDNFSCDTTIQSDISYDSNLDNYSLSLVLLNKSNNIQSISLESLKNSNLDDVDGFKETEVSLEKDEEKIINFNLNLEEKDDLILKYKCNDMLFTKNIDFQYKEEFKEDISNLTSYFSFVNLKVIINSISFQLILVLILVGLVLSFSTRYIKLLYKKK
ncbi:MAG: hypothetical protein WCY27_01540 [archaeon]|jgi:hypothetical protein|nr:hypothetical protein [archaeon]MDD2477856.1 hypothetical protein [Candidatus ainarchaeum sp.]MDD3084591.1 hypothetical protein [Candidatus ainarchaeum sp.]MDD4221120.1 hypothetical protein [Candidatus ainarchaeum sp.]MDD4662607.1 hypothetical protein [Candidatus ainarchaeum sp.]